MPTTPARPSLYRTVRRRSARVIALVCGGAAACVGAVWWHLARAGEGGAATDLPRDPVLRAAAITFYRPPARFPAPRAVVFFFGNDVGFWRPHQRLAADLAQAGYAVAGFDIRPTLARLPNDRAGRDRAFAAHADSLIERAYAELGGPPGRALGGPRAAGAPPVPLVLMGHSLGAELALWIVAHGATGAARVPVGVVALSPGLRSHLRVSAADLLMTGEPTDAESFSVPATLSTAVRAVPGLRVAIVRGSQDKLRYADSALLAAGGARVRRFGVPFAAHSLAHLALARFVVRDAVAWVLREGGPPDRAPRTAASPPPEAAD